MTEEEKRKLQAIFDVLDAECGDTDPADLEDWTDDEIIEEEPIFWACRELSKLIK